MDRRYRVKKKYGWWYHFWKTAKWVLAITLVVGTIVGVYGLGIFTTYAEQAPKLNPELLANPTSSRIYDVKGELIAEVGEETRVEIEIEDVPVRMMDAIIAIEDARFWYHKGIDPIRIGGAAVNNVLGGAQQGGSTITQQLVKLAFLDQNDSSLERKSKEAVLSWDMEDRYSKDEILTFYINKVYMGNGIYGLGTASDYYFGKPLEELELHQQALLAGIPNAPNSYNPYGNQEYATQRRDRVLNAMLSLNMITQEEHDVALEKDVMDGVLEEGKDIYKDVDQEYIEYVNMVYDELKEHDVNLLDGGYDVYTYLDQDAQKNLYNYVYNDTQGYADRGLEVVVGVVNVDNGGVRALAGGNGDTEIVPLGFSYPAEGRLQAGSAGKTPIAYAPALEYLGLTMDSIVQDEPYVYASGQAVRNFDGQFYGDLTMERALILSRNTTALHLQRRVGKDKSIAFANKLGLNIPEDEWVESAVLSANATMIDLATSYASIANNGYANQSTYLREVQTEDGEVLHKQPEGEQVLSQNNAKDLINSLRHTTQSNWGFGTRAYVNGYDLVGKTGTTNYGSNEGMPNGHIPSVLFAGATPDVAVAVTVQGSERSRGLRYSHDEDKLAQYATSHILPLVTDDKSNFK